MENSDLYLVSCDNPQVRQYFKRLVLEEIDQGTSQRYLDKDYENPVHLWGIPQQKGERYKRMDIGDFLLFYLGDGEYRYAARVLGMEQNQELTQALENKFSQNIKNIAPLDRWKYWVHLQSPFPVTIDSRRLHDYAGHSRDRPFNITKLNKQGHKSITGEYGDIETYLLSHSDNTSNNVFSRSESDLAMQLETADEVVNKVSKQTGSRASTISNEVSKLDKRNIPLREIYQAVRQKHDSNADSSILSIDGVGIVRGARLLAAGYETTEAVSNKSVKELAAVPEISTKSARVIKEHAEEIVAGRNTAEDIAARSDDSITEIECTLKTVGTTGVPRSKAQPIVTRLHNHPSLLDIHGIQRQTAYHLIDQGYETPEQVAEADPEALTEVPHVGDKNVKTIQENAAELATETDLETHSSPPSELRLSKLDAQKRKKANQILGVDDLDSLNEEDWDTALSRFFSELIDSPFDFRLNSEN